MINLKLITENPDLVKEKIRIRQGGTELVQVCDELIDLDRKRRELICNTDNLRKSRNEISREIGNQKLEDQNVDIDELSSEVSGIKSELENLDIQLQIIDERVKYFLDIIPNILDDSVPIGVDDNDNPVIREWGDKIKFSFSPLDHKELGVNLGILDLDRGAKLTGSGFPLYRAEGAQLERALMQFMLDIHTKEHGYIEYWTPFLVNRDTMHGTGQLPKFEKDLYWVENGSLGLIPTAEVPLTNIHKGEILLEKELPLYYTAYTPCFRQEAGQHGKETRGLIRVHQFNKVELVKITNQETSYDELEKLTQNAEKILQLLNLPYRVIVLCSADTGFAAAKTYDIEVWLPSQQKYREISSCSNCIDFQARRMNLTYRKKKDNKTQYVHTLNGSGVAVGRAWVAVVENYQQEDGSIIIPDVLLPYMNGKKKIENNFKNILDV